MRSLLLAFLVHGLGLMTLSGKAPGPDVLSASSPAILPLPGPAGLSNASVYAVLEGSDGRLWVASQDGLFSSNGSSWTTHPLPTGTRTSYLRALAETPDGAIWVGTEHSGLWRLKQGQWEGFRKGQVLPSDRVNTLQVAMERDGRAVLWVGTQEGIARFDGTQWESSVASRGLPSPWVWRFRTLRDTEGHSGFWVCTMKGAARWTEQGWEASGALGSLPGAEVNDILDVPTPEGGTDLWISSWGKGVYRRHLGRWELHGPARGFPSLHPVGLALGQDPSGRRVVWVATYDAGISRFGSDGWRSFRRTSRLGSDGVYSLTPSRVNPSRLWLGLRSGGVARIEGTGWSIPELPPSTESREVLSLAESRGEGGEAVHWVGTSHGLYRWEGGRWHLEGTEAGLPDPYVLALHASPPGKGPVEVFAGTLKGLAQRQGGRWRALAVPHLSSTNRIHCLLMARNRDLWVGTDWGLVRVRGRASELFTQVDRVNLEQAYALAETEEGLWVGLRGGGVVHLREGRWTTWGAERGLPHSSVYSLIELRDTSGVRWLWAATFGGGAARLRLGDPMARWESFGRDRIPALPSDVMVGVQQDEAGRIYLATRQGVARLTFHPGIATPGVDTFTEGDGLPSASCLYGGTRKDSWNRIWVATHRGLAVFDPGQEALPVRPDRVLFEPIRCANLEIPAEPGKTFDHQHNTLRFNWGLPSFHRSEDTEYATQLLGLEAKPTAWGPEGAREFVALRPGSYALRVWARDPRGRETGPIDLPFRILPAPWLSLPALASYLVALAGLLLGSHYLRIRWLADHNRELSQRVESATEALRHKHEALEQLNEDMNQFVGVVAHDLRNPLNAVLLAAQQLDDPENTPVDLAHFGNIILKATRQMTDLVGNLLEVNRADTGHLRLACTQLDARILLEEVWEAFDEGARAKGIRCVLEAEPGIALWVDPMRMTNILSNLVSNALKFMPIRAEGSRIWLRACAAGDWTRLEVQDEGPGFSEEDQARAFGRFARLSARPTGGEASTGLGLSIVKLLTEAMGGRISLISEAGHGALFRLELPAGPPPDQLKVP